MITLRTNILFLLCLLAFTALGKAPLSKGSIEGVVKDKISTAGLPFASLQLFSSSTAFRKGCMTDAHGYFSLENIPFGDYLISASYMGYQTHEMRIVVDKKTQHIKLAMVQQNIDLSEVEIVSEEHYLEQSIEMTTINVSKDATVAAGTAMDVMQTLPSVDFDFDGNLYYRGSDKVTLLLNGQQSEMVKSLDQIPADQIERIELINNPSAKYDAQGMSGIINIVLKSGKRGTGKSSVMVYAGYPETAGGNAGYNFNNEKNQFFVTAGINHKTKFQTKEHLRENYEDPDAFNYYQYDRQDENLNDVFLNTSYAHAFSTRHKLSASLVGASKFNTADRGIQYTTLNDSGKTVYDAYKDIDISLDNMLLDGNLNYLFKMNKKGQQLKTNLHYTLLDQLQQMNNTYYPDPEMETTALQNTDSKQLNKIMNWTMDYAQPFNDSMKLETGYKLDIKNLLNDFYSESFDDGTGQWIEDTALSNRFNYEQYINAVYVDARFKLKKYDIQAGLRAEYTYNKQDGKKKDAYFDLFPSINISRQLGSYFAVFIAYNRRINRPTIKMLNPYTAEYADILNMHRGNPDLKPEYVNSFEAGTQYFSDKLSGSVSFYYRLIDQAISRVKFATNDSALMVTYMNLDQAKLFGGTFSLSWQAFDWWKLGANANIFYSHLSGTYGPNVIERKHTGWTASLSNRFKLPAGIGIQLNGYYKSKMPDVMGTYLARYYIDMAVSKSIIKGKGKLVFKISDVFNTYRYGLDLVGLDENGYYYSQTNRRKNESQYFILSFYYNLDRKDKAAKKGNFYLDNIGK